MVVRVFSCPDLTGNGALSLLRFATTHQCVEVLKISWLGFAYGAVLWWQVLMA